MRRSLVASVLALALALGASAMQNSGTAPKKKSPAKPAADCTALTDAALGASVKDKLANTPSLKDYAIAVAAKDGTVTLTGTVRTGRNKGTATLQAKRVQCVKKVENQIMVESSPAKSSKSRT